MVETTPTFVKMDKYRMKIESLQPAIEVVDRGELLHKKCMLERDLEKINLYLAELDKLEIE
jgi:hypothetical protein